MRWRAFNKLHRFTAGLVQDELERVMREKEQLLNDYESYKVRVHSVLKQQKKKEKHDELYDGDAKM